MTEPSTAAVSPAAAGGQQQQQQPNNSIWSIIQLVMSSFMLAILFSNLLTVFLGGDRQKQKQQQLLKQQQQLSRNGEGEGMEVLSTSDGFRDGSGGGYLPFFHKDELIRFQIYLSPQPTWAPANVALPEEYPLIWSTKEFPFGGVDQNNMTKVLHWNVTISPKLLRGVPSNESSSHCVWKESVGVDSQSVAADCGSQSENQTEELWAHFFVSKAAAELNPTSPNFDQTAVIHKNFPLLLQRKKTKKELKLRNKRMLLQQFWNYSSDGNSSTTTIAEGLPSVADGSDSNDILYLKTYIPFSVIEDWNVYHPNYLPPQLLKHVRFYDSDEEASSVSATLGEKLPPDVSASTSDLDSHGSADSRDTSDQGSRSPPRLPRHIRGWFPVVFVNEFAILQESFVELNTSRIGDNITLQFEFDPMSVIRWQFYIQMQESVLTMQKLDDSGGDDLKEMILRTNSYLLAVTIAVSLLHMVFDFLAFKNDIQFWRNRSDYQRLSLSTLLFSLVAQTIVFLYLQNNDTSWLVLISSGAGILIESWKVRKICSVHFVWRRFAGGRITLPALRLQRKQQSEIAASTQEYDERAASWLYAMLFPCVVGYAGYSLLVHEHEGWYSFVLSTLVSCIYTFGFIMMTPQLFINYKLKSVAHLPWRTFVYKALNTFIDDLFAFIIKMPTLHRLGCFRDDIIFFIYLYQRYIYRVDYSRTNEFGQQASPPPQSAASTDQNETQPRPLALEEKKDQ